MLLSPLICERLYGMNEGFVKKVFGLMKAIYLIGWPSLITATMERQDRHTPCLTTRLVNRDGGLIELSFIGI